MKQLSHLSCRLESLIRLLAKNLECKEIAKLAISITEMQTSTTVNVCPGFDDYGKICGTKGVMINALTRLYELIGARNSRRVRLVLDKAQDGKITDRPEFKVREDWNNKAIRELAETVCALIFGEFKVNASDNGQSTTLEIVFARGDKMKTNQPVIEESLSVILKSVGKAQGRTQIFVDLAEGDV